MLDGHLAVAAARNHRFASLLDNEVPQGVGIVGPVRQHVAGEQAFQQRLGLGRVAGRARGQAHAQQPAGRVDQDVQLGAMTAPAAAQGLGLRAACTDVAAHVRGVQVHPAQVRPFSGQGLQQAFPDPVQAPAAKDAVPVAEAGRQVAPGDARAHQVHDPVQEAAQVVGMPGAHLGVPAQMAVQGLEFDVAEGVAGHGGGSVKGETDRAAMIRRPQTRLIPYVHTPGLAQVLAVASRARTERLSVMSGRRGPPPESPAADMSGHRPCLPTGCRTTGD